MLGPASLFLFTVYAAQVKIELQILASLRHDVQCPMGYICFRVLDIRPPLCWSRVFGLLSSLGAHNTLVSTQYQLLSLVFYTGSLFLPSTHTPIFEKEFHPAGLEHRVALNF